jgi:hypothetical protein
MNWSKFRFQRHYRLTPPALVRMPNGTWARRDWEWFAGPGDDNTITLHHARSSWSPSLGRDNFHSFQDGHLLMRGQLFLFDSGPGFRVRPFRTDCRDVTEALLNRIRELLAR